MSSFEIVDAEIANLHSSFCGWFGDSTDSWPGYSEMEAVLLAQHGWTADAYYQELHAQNVAWENAS